MTQISLSNLIQLRSKTELLNMGSFETPSQNFTHMYNQKKDLIWNDPRVILASSLIGVLLTFMFGAYLGY